MSKVKILHNYYDLGYIDVEVPIETRQVGGEEMDIITVKMGVVEKLVTKTIIEQKIPIRGKEVKFMRKALGLSLDKFSRDFEITSTTVMKWEKNEDKRLSLVNELAIRMFIKEALDLDIDITFYDLDARSKVPSQPLKLAA